MHVALLDPTTPERMARFQGFLPAGWTISTAASRSPRDQLAALEGAQFAVTGDVPVTAAMMAVPGLVAVHKWGVGYDNIDLDAAGAHGVRVLRTTGSNAVAVAESTLGLILALNRNLVRGHVGILDGKWLKGELSASSMRLTGKTVGIIGLGYIGKALARLLAGFGCRILYSKRTPLPEAEEAALGVHFSPLENLLRESDVVTLNCELNASTRNLIDADRLALMKPDAILVNAARGGVMVEADVAAAVRAGRLRGAAVDVFETEPLPADNPLRGIDGIILTPHVGAISSDSYGPNVSRMVANMQALAEGGTPREIDILV